MSIRNHTWFKSSYSSGEGGECVELAYTWRKSTHSSGEHPAAIHIRDSKTPTTPHLTVSPVAWSAFVSSGTDRDRIGNRRS